MADNKVIGNPPPYTGADFPKNCSKTPYSFNLGTESNKNRYLPDKKGITTKREKNQINKNYYFRAQCFPSVAVICKTLLNFEIYMFSSHNIAITKAFV